MFCRLIYRRDEAFVPVSSARRQWILFTKSLDYGNEPTFYYKRESWILVSTKIAPQVGQNMKVKLI